MDAVAVLMLVCGVFTLFTGCDEPRGSYVPASFAATEAPVLPAVGTPVPGEVKSTDTMYVHRRLNIRSTPAGSGAIVRMLTRGAIVQLGPMDENGCAPCRCVRYARRLRLPGQRQGPVRTTRGPGTFHAPQLSGLWLLYGTARRVLHVQRERPQAVR